MAKENFVTDFGNIPEVSWNRSNYFDEAMFVKNGKVMTAYYDFGGKLVGTTEPSTFNDIPVNAQNGIHFKYKDYSICPVIFFDDNELNETDMMIYSKQFKNADNYFVELTKGNRKIMLRVDTSGFANFFRDL